MVCIGKKESILLFGTLAKAFCFSACWQVIRTKCIPAQDHHVDDKVWFNLQSCPFWNYNRI